MELVLLHTALLLEYLPGWNKVLAISIRQFTQSYQAREELHNVEIRRVQGRIHSSAIAC